MFESIYGMGDLLAITIEVILLLFAGRQNINYLAGLRFCGTSAEMHGIPAGVSWKDTPALVTI
jgi:hypothetical protein